MEQFYDILPSSARKEDGSYDFVVTIVESGPNEPGEVSLEADGLTIVTHPVRSRVQALQSAFNYLGRFSVDRVG